MIRRTMTQPTLNSNVRSNTSSITMIILITKLWLSVALRSDPVQWSHNAASSKIVSSAPASSGRRPGLRNLLALDVMIQNKTFAYL